MRLSKRRGAWLFAPLISATLFGFSAQSQEPTPSAGEPRQPEQTQSQPAQQSPAGNQPNAAPPPIIVNVLPTPKTEAERADEAHERKEKAELDRRLVELTGELAYFTAGLFAATIALFIATGGLAYFAFVQSRDMKASVAVAQKAAEAADLSARAAVGTELPIVFLKRIDVMAQDPQGPNGEVIPFLPPVPSNVTVWFNNYGRTPAILLHLFIDWDVVSRLPDEPVYQRLYPLDGVIEPGDKFEFHTDADVIFDAAQNDAAVRGQKRFWVYGYLSYADFLRTEHRIGFCAVWRNVGEGPFYLMEAGTDKYVYQN
jgi:hypothetical protein